MAFAIHFIQMQLLQMQPEPEVIKTPSVAETTIVEESLVFFVLEFDEKNQKLVGRFKNFPENATAQTIAEMVGVRYKI